MADNVTFDSNGNPVMNLEPMVITGDITPVVVTAKKIPVSFGWQDWLQPPRLFISLGIVAGLFLVFAKSKKRRRRK